MSYLLNIVKGDRVVVKEYSLNFFTEPGCGCSFPCDENGVVKGLPSFAKKNYKDCLAHPEKFPYAFNEVEMRSYSYRESDIGKCSCGEEVELINEYMGACECKGCGQWYNVFGQELLNPEYWEE